MSKRFPAFHGTIQSSHKVCIRDRPVLLFSVRPGKDKFLGGDRSNLSGYWKVDISKTLASGAYYSVAKAFGSPDAGFICRSDRSRLAVVD